MADNVFAPGQVLKHYTSKKGNEVVIRCVTLSDISQLTEYMNALSREDVYVSWSGEQMTEEDERVYIETVMKEMAEGRKCMICACIGEELVGAADLTQGVRRSTHVGKVNLSVKNGYRSEGIGSAMMEVQVALAKQLGLKALELIVYHPNLQAIHVYEKAGFQEVGRIPEKAHYKGTLIDEVIMYKKL